MYDIEGTYIQNVLRRVMHLSKQKSKRRLTALSLIFALIFTVGVVYAATTGVLTFSGTATLGADVELRIISLTPALMTVSTDGQTATITVSFDAPGDFEEIYFMVENTGAVAVIVTAIDDSSVQAPLKLGGNYATIMGATFDPAADEFYELIVEWEAGVNDSASGTFTFTITIDYAIVP
jgi:hypothetical protein